MVNQLPQGWKEEELGKHADIKRGSTITKKQVVLGDYPVIAGGKEAAYYHNEYNRQPPVITVSGSGASAGYVNYWEVPIFASDCSTIEEKDLNIKYIYYFLKSRQQELLDKQVGVAIPHVSPKDIYPLLIPYPTDEDEQEYIVKTLDAVAEMIKLRKETIQLTKDLIPAIFQEMFGDPITNPKGWEILSLYNIITQINNGYNPPKKDFGTGIPFVTVNNLYDGLSIDYDSLDKVVVSNKQIQKYKLNYGDICFVRSSVKREGIGQASAYLSNQDAIFGGFVIRVTPNEIFNPIFLSEYFQTEAMRNIIINKSVTGVMTNINQPALLSIPVLNVPFYMQEEFAKKVEQINKYIVAQQEELEHFETLFQSLLQEAFTGVLTWKYPRKENND